MENPKNLSKENAFMSFMNQSIGGGVDQYSIRLRYAEKGDRPEIIESEVQAYQNIQKLRENKKLIAEYLLKTNRPTVAYAIAKYSTHIATGIRG